MTAAILRAIDTVVWACLNVWRLVSAIEFSLRWWFWLVTVGTGILLTVIYNELVWAIGELIYAIPIICEKLTALHATADATAGYMMGQNIRTVLENLNYMMPIDIALSIMVIELEVYCACVVYRFVKSWLNLL